MLNKAEKEVMESLLKFEKHILGELESQYKQALRDINHRIRILQANPLTQSKIYQLEYQKALKAQVAAIVDKMHGDNYTTIQGYLNDSYQHGYVGAMYSLHKQNMPVIVPINQNAAVQAILTDSNLSEPLYNHLGVSIQKLKTGIRQEITRGLATGLTFQQMARNLADLTKAPLSNAKTIVFTEGHRIQEAATDDARHAAAARGCDLVKQWDAFMDDKTRDSHRRLDGEIRELDEDFSNGLRYPGDPRGPAEEVINCRCVALSRPRKAMNTAELQTLKDKAAYWKLDKTDSFEDFERKFLKAK